MKLEDQVVSLELAKRLKELGIKQKSMFYYIDHVNGHKIFPVITDHDREIFNLLIHDVMPPTLYSAFTSFELGEMLPNCTPITTVRSLINTYLVSSYSNYPPFEESNEANARAKLLIHLLESGVIKNEQNP